MTELMVQGAKWYIHQRNTLWELYEAAAASAIARDIGAIVAEYCLGIERVIQEDVAYSFIYCRNDEPDNVHGINVLRSYCSDYVDFTYYCGYSKIPDIYTSTCRFEWSEYLEFILTGFNKQIFSNMLRMFNTLYPWSKYNNCKQCSDSSERMLANLRADMLKYV